MLSRWLREPLPAPALEELQIITTPYRRLGLPSVRDELFIPGFVVNRKRSERAEATRVARRFAENLVSQRRQTNLSQVETAERSGLHRSEISLLERGLRVPRLDTIVQVAAGVEAEPCDLLAGMAWKLERNRLHDVDAPPGCFEIEVRNRWERV